MPANRSIVRTTTEKSSSLRAARWWARSTAATCEAATVAGIGTDNSLAVRKICERAAYLFQLFITAYYGRAQTFNAASGLRRDLRPQQSVHFHRRFFAFQLQGRDRFEIKEPLGQPVGCRTDKNFSDR